MEPNDEDQGKAEPSEGFCPACSQPRLSDVIKHQPYCPLSKGYPHYDDSQPDYERW